MSNLAIFSNESFGNVRITMIDGNPWFVAKDVCECLGLDTSNLSKLLDEDELSTCPVQYTAQVRNLSIVSEPGLYSLVLRSRKPEAKAFKRWIIHEVLPSIRKTGGYGQTTLPNFNNPVEAARAWADAKEAEMLAQAKVVELAPKADTYDNVVADRQCTLTDFARKLRGVNTVAIKRSLLNNDIMYRMGDRYKVYSKYRDTFFEEKYDAYRGVTQIIVLDKGKQLLTKLYKEHKLIMKGQK